MSEAKVIRFPLKDVNVTSRIAVAEKEIVDSNSINALPEMQQPEITIISISTEEIELMKRESYEAGYKDGLTSASQSKEQAQDELTSRLSKLTSKIEEIDKVHFESLKDLSREAANLSIQVAKKLMGEVSNIQEHRLFTFFDDVFDKIKNESSIVISLEPELAKSVTDKLRELLKIKNIKSSVTIITSEQLSADECHIDWNSGKAILNHEEILRSLEKEIKNKTSAIVSGLENQTLQNLS